MTDRELLSVRAYAKRRGVSHTAVGKAIKSLRLRDSVVRQGSKLYVDPAIADVEWTKNTDVAQQRGAESRATGNSSSGNRGNPVSTDPEIRPTQSTLWGDAERAETKSAPNGEDTSLRGGYLEARTQRELLRAERERLELGRLSGNSIDAGAARAATFEAARESRDLLRGMIERITPSLAAEGDPVRVRALLDREVDVALSAIVELLERYADGDSDERA